jgi:hypothetical protein
MFPYFYGRTVNVPPPPLRFSAYESEFIEQRQQHQIETDENRNKIGACAPCLGPTRRGPALSDRSDSSYKSDPLSPAQSNPVKPNPTMPSPHHDKPIRPYPSKSDQIRPTFSAGTKPAAQMGFKNTCGFNSPADNLRTLRNC